MTEIAVKTVLDNITETFSRLDMAAWFACFHQPHIIAAGNRNVSPKTLAECKATMGEMFEKLRQQHFVKSTLDYQKIKMLSEKSAVASAVWSRWDNNEKLIQRFGATYFLNEIDGRWGVSFLSTHAADKILLD